MRNLASIQVIKEVIPHTNAEKLEIVRVLGWRCVTGKGDYQVGDKIVYVETDSILPDEPQFADIRKRSSRIKAIKLRGEVSMGLVLPLKVLEGRKYPEDTRENPTYDLTEGKDVTALLGVTKWEPNVPACLSGEVAGPFPTDLLPKTDETRLQAYPEILTRYPGITFVACEKVNGSSCSILKHEGRLRICGRNWEFKETTMNSFRQVVVREKIEERLPEGWALQGELAGPGIQGNPLKLEQQEIFFFNVSNIKERKYLPHVEFNHFCSEHGFKMVPVIFVWDDISKWTVDDLVKIATKRSHFNPTVWAEGLVVRPMMAEIRDPDLGRLSFKILNAEALLEEN